MKTKTIITTLLCAITAFVMGVTPVSAATNDLVNSVGSSASDETAGVDATQGKSTSYVTPDEIKTTTYTGDEATTVYATKTSYVIVTIPKVLVLGETETKGTYAGSFNVKIQADIAGSQSVTITPIIKDSLQEVNGKNTDIATSITIDGQSSITLGANDFLDDVTVTKVGEIKSTNVVAGAYDADVTFEIKVNNN